IVASSVFAQAPSITKQPTNVIATTGGQATFSVVATGALPLAYQWRKIGVAIQGWTNATLTLDGVSTNDTVSYDVVVTNAAGQATSTSATLTINDPVMPPVTQPPLTT